MKNHANRRSVGMKTFVAMLALVLVIGCAVGGTVAWLTAQTEPVVNTFTCGNINIDLTETKPEDRQAKIIPGVDIEKDPKVIVKANSEACWLFVEVKKEGTFVADKVTYSIANDWTEVDGMENVYYREVNAATTDQEFYVLEDNKVTVSEDLTKSDIQSITVQPKLTFTAYAVQKDGITDVADAWAKANPTPTP
ncbi:SipW-dependent-type signal peptide-containing protein [Oscillospiraceae bacterium HCP3S3_F4]